MNPEENFIGTRVKTKGMVMIFLASLFKNASMSSLSKKIISYHETVQSHDIGNRKVSKHRLHI